MRLGLVRPSAGSCFAFWDVPIKQPSIKCPYVNYNSSSNWEEDKTITGNWWTFQNSVINFVHILIARFTTLLYPRTKLKSFLNLCIYFTGSKLLPLPPECCALWLYPRSLGLLDVFPVPHQEPTSRSPRLLKQHCVVFIAQPGPFSP